MDAENDVLFFYNVEANRFYEVWFVDWLDNAFSRPGKYLLMILTSNKSEREL